MPDPSSAELREYVRALYDACPSGAAFELFLKLVLSRMGLEDVSVTRYTRDGGIDLTARRAGLEELSRMDEVKYVVQAKRFAPDRAVPIDAVRALRGVMGANEKGLFITTGRFTSDTEVFAAADQTRPIVLIDGEHLVRLCVEREIGFVFRPFFDLALLQTQVRQLDTGSSRELSQQVAPVGSAPNVRTFLKTVTSNDIRARIISVPWQLDEQLPENATALSIEFPPHFDARAYQYRRDRKYIAGVTDVLRKFGLLAAGDERRPRLAEWQFAPGDRPLRVVFTDEAVPDTATRAPR